MSVRVHTALLIGLILIGGACGRKAPPRPPADVQPATIRDLHATHVAHGIRLAWSRPRLYNDGTRMRDLGRFIIERAIGIPPHTFTPLVTLDVDDQHRFRQLKRFAYVDRDLTIEESYHYRVVSLTTDGYASAPSNIATITRQQVEAAVRTPPSSSP